MKALYPILFIMLGSAIHSSLANESQQRKIVTTVVPAVAAETQVFEWGRLITYYSGETWSSRDALTAVAIIHPGKQIHPPHVHSEEEYLMVLEGEATWIVKGEHFPASAGDVLYAAPWDEHGIENTGETQLRFVFFKWNPKPVEPMEPPTVNN